MRVIVILAFIFTASCATVAVQPQVDLGGGLRLLLPPPAEVTQPLRAVQVLTVSRPGHVETFQVIFENQKNKMILAIVSPLWPTPLRAEYDGEQIKIDKKLSANIPFDFQYVLADIVLVHAPLDSLKRWLSAEIFVADSAGKRELTRQTKGSTQKMIQIEYKSKDHWSGSLQITNFERQYKIDIRTLRVEYL